MLKHSEAIRGCSKKQRTFCYRMYRCSYLTVGNLDVAPPAVNHMPLGEASQLGLIASESNKSEAFALPGLCVFLYLKEHITSLSDGREIPDGRRIE